MTYLILRKLHVEYSDGPLMLSWLNSLFEHAGNLEELSFVNVQGGGVLSDFDENPRFKINEMRNLKSLRLVRTFGGDFTEALVSAGRTTIE